MSAESHVLTDKLPHRPLGLGLMRRAAALQLCGLGVLHPEVPFLQFIVPVNFGVVCCHKEACCEDSDPAPLVAALSCVISEGYVQTSDEQSCPEAGREARVPAWLLTGKLFSRAVTCGNNTRNSALGS